MSFHLSSVSKSRYNSEQKDNIYIESSLNIHGFQYSREGLNVIILGINEFSCIIMGSISVFPICTVLILTFFTASMQIIMFLELYKWFLLSYI